MERSALERMLYEQGQTMIAFRTFTAPAEHEHRLDCSYDHDADLPDDSETAD